MKNIYSRDGVNIGNVPDHWEVNKTLRCLEMPITDGPHETPESVDEENGIPFVSAEAVSCGNGSIDFNHIWGFISQDYYEECCKKYVPQIDDIYMIKSGATTGKVSIVDTDRIFTIWSPLAVFRANKDIVAPRYMFYFLQSPIYLSQVELGWNYGTQQNIGMRVLEKLYICYPDILEQQAIVRYLDSKCSAIDEAIERHKKIIEKLEEYRKSSVTKAVTKGIDPTTYKTVDSSWIKEIPSHWDFVPLKSLIHIVDTRNEDPNARLLSLYTAVGVKPRADLEERGNKATTVVGYKNVSEGDIILNKLLAWMGAVAYSDYDGVTSPDYDIYRHNDGANITRDFYHYYFRYTNFKDDCFVNGHGLMMMRWRTYPYELLRIKVPNPPAEEQIKIGRYLRKINDAIDLSIEKRNGIINKLEEYRKSIIYNAVTGKIDCREA